MVKRFEQYDEKHCEMTIDDKDRKLLALLAANSRESTAELARKMGLSRTTVTSRIERLERSGVISAYTIRYREDFAESQIRAHVMIRSDPKRAAAIFRALGRIQSVSALHTVNGEFDMLAMVNTRSTRELDEALDRIGNVPGVDKTVSSIILTTRFER